MERLLRFIQRSGCDISTVRALGRLFCLMVGLSAVIGLQLAVGIDALTTLFDILVALATYLLMVAAPAVALASLWLASQPNFPSDEFELENTDHTPERVA